MKTSEDRHKPITRTLRAWITMIALLSVTPVLAGPLDRAVDLEIRNTNLGLADISISIRDLDSGAELASHNENEALIPASNMKVLTSGAAAIILGTDFTFETKFKVHTTQSRTVLVIEGSGDPALGDPEITDGQHKREAVFDALAKALKERGVARVDEIVVNDRVFDRDWAHDCWPDDQLNRWYCAELGGLNYHTNVINVYPSPGTPGSAPMVRMDPDLPWTDMRIRAKSISKGRDSAWVARPRPENAFTLFGNVRGPTEIPVSVHEPARFAAEVIAIALNSRGIDVNNGDIRNAVRLITPEDQFPDAYTAAIISTPIDEVLRRTNTDSHNLYAECLLKRIGHEITGDRGSWDNGTSVLRLMISDHLGTDSVQSSVLHDGSGMCRQNRVTTRTLTEWMRVMSKDDAWDVFISSFATPGEGTLRRRFTDGEITGTLHAKSGYLNGVYALTGVLEHNGRRAAFSIILNNVKPGTNSRNAKPFIDSVVVALDKWITGKSDG